MEQRPHNRKKTVGSGSVGVGKNGHGGYGGGPVGSGGRVGLGASGPRTGSTGGNGGNYPRGGLPFKLNLKTILIIVAVVIIGSLLLRNCGGESLLSGLMGGGVPSVNSVDTVDTATSDREPDRSVDAAARAKRVIPVGGGNDIVNVMVYMCGTDLESKHGMATADLNEMMKAKIADNLHITVLTGGCKSWQTSEISSSKNQIYQVESGRMVRLEKDYGTAAMTDPANLTKFIKYCTDRYPDATRNILIFWDHGGGTISGYGYDEKKPNASSMTLPKIASALKAAECEFDFIGFDACLMATLETALVCNDCADYLIASEETEPGTGWYYTNWLTELSKDTSLPTVDVARRIIDDFVSASCSSSPGSGVTLSVVDLAELDGTLPKSFKEFASSTADLIRSDYKTVSNARANVRQFSRQSRINQVDMVDLANRIGTSEAKTLADVLKKSVKYNKSTISNSYGLSVYFPYEDTSSVKTVTSAYESIDIDDEYTDCIKSFASLNFGGQLAGAASQYSGGSIGGDLLGTLLSSYTSSGSSTSPIAALAGSFLGSGGSASAGNGIGAADIISLLSGLSGRSMPAEYDWVDTSLIAGNARNIAEGYVDPSHITASEKAGHSVLNLTDAEWKNIQKIELNLFVPDGDGYIDLGLDNTFEWYNDDSVLLEYDGTWLTVNGNVCAYYLVSDTKRSSGTWITEGRIPALLNGQRVDLRVIFDEELCPEGEITGATPTYDDDTVSVKAKGEIPIEKGDTIEFLCDYYGKDGSYKDTYKLGTSLTVPGNGLRLENLQLEADDISAMYRITDIYDNHFWLPVN